jgi:hypothetical protein
MNSKAFLKNTNKRAMQVNAVREEYIPPSWGSEALGKS